MTSFLTFMVVCANSQFAYIIQRKLHCGLIEDVNFITVVFYFHVKNNILLFCYALLKYCFYHSKIKFISLHHCVISSIYVERWRREKFINSKMFQPL